MTFSFYTWENVILVITSMDCYYNKKRCYYDLPTETVGGTTNKSYFVMRQLYLILTLFFGIIGLIIN